MDKAYRELGSAICISAVELFKKQYEYYLQTGKIQKIRKTKKGEVPESETINQTITFILSSRFEILSGGMDGKYVLISMSKELENKTPRIKKDIPFLSDIL